MSASLTAPSSGRPRGTLVYKCSSCGRSGSPREFAAHEWRDLGAEQLDRAQHALVRQRAHAELHEKAIVPEDLVLEEDLLGHLLGVADEVGPMEGDGRLELVRT